MALTSHGDSRINFLRIPAIVGSRQRVADPHGSSTSEIIDLRLQQVLLQEACSHVRQGFLLAL